MLRDHEKERIRQEEVYRAEVRKALDQTAPDRPGAKTKLWKFLNTTFGIWLLSTVVVGLITWAYSNWTAQTTARQATAERIRKLDQEIVARIGTLRTRLNDVQTREYLDDVIGRLDFAKGAGGSLFPELEDRTLNSLLMELYGLVPDDEKAEVKSAFVGSRKLVELRGRYVEEASFGSRDSVGRRPIGSGERERVIGILNAHFRLRRWRSLDMTGDGG